VRGRNGRTAPAVRSVVVSTHVDDRLARARSEFAPDVVHLNTPTVGLAPRRTLAAVTAALDEWRAGTVDAPSYDTAVERARARYAELVATTPDRVAIGSQASVLVGLVAAALPAGARVVVASDDFTSVLFPFLTQAARGVQVEEVPLDRVVEATAAGADWVAVSAVQSRDGRVLDLAALADACAASGTRSLVDLTQAAGWLPVDASRADVTVASAYKWLLSPRGAAFLTVSTRLQDELLPHGSGWYAGEDPWDSIYGTPLRLARDARRFDVSPAWHSWVGAAESLDLLLEVGRERLHRNAIDLANRFRRGVGLDDGDSAIVSLEATTEGQERLAAARVVGSVRAGRVRLGFHVSTTDDDVDAAVEALRGHVALP
jgi:selenocysteine lyase/cysteine desulfurase